MMKHVLKQIKSYLPLTIGIIILLVVAPLVPWDQVWQSLGRLSPVTIGLLILWSLVYHAGRILRYWLMLAMLERPLAFDKVALACLAAQPAALLPGGELYRITMLKRYGNVSLTHTGPSVFAQSIAESIGLIAIALVSVAFLHRYVLIVLIIAAIFAGIILFIKHHDSRLTHRLVNKVPGVQIRHSPLQIFLSKNQTLLTGRNLFLLVAVSLVSTLAGIAIIYEAAQGLGVKLDVYQAAIAYSISAVLAAVTLLPAGLGANEQGLVAILSIFHVATGPAVAITLLMRIFTLGVGFIYGYGAIAWAKLTRITQYHTS